MRQLLAPILFLLALVVTRTEAGASLTVGCIVKGLVTTESDAPVADVTVRVITATDGMAVKTGSDGAFSVTAEAGDGTVSATASRSSTISAVLRDCTPRRTTGSTPAGLACVGCR